MLTTAVEKKQDGSTIAIPSTLFTPPSEIKTVNPIIDIPKVPFDETKHKKALNSGRCIKEICENAIELQRLHAPGNKPGSGFGTAAFRELVQLSIEEKCPGKIKTEVSTSYGSPHLFYLYMGMAPIFYQFEGPPVYTREESYLSHMYGMVGRFALEELESLDEWTADELSKLSQYRLDQVKSMLSNELKLDADQITLADIIKNKDLLFSLRTKKLDYLSGVFIPTILRVLAEDPKNKYPNTNILGARCMYLTEKGYQRWKYVIDNKLEFVPFRRLEHLDLTAEQQKQINEILEHRAKPALKSSSR